jgi:hypothetical protein
MQTVVNEEIFLTKQGMKSFNFSKLVYVSVLVIGVLFSV